MKQRIALAVSIVLSALGLTVIAHGEDLNYIGQMELLVTAPEQTFGARGSHSLSFRFAGMARRPSIYYGFGADVLTLSHDWSDITVAQAADLGAGLQAWADNPHSLQIMNGPTGLSVSGSAYPYTPDTVPSVLFQVYTWTGTNPHHHGGSYMVLNLEESRELGEIISAWAARPTYGIVYQRSVY